jgi:hypothetical protein
MHPDAHTRRSSRNKQESFESINVSKRCSIGILSISLQVLDPNCLTTLSADMCPSTVQHLIAYSPPQLQQTHLHFLMITYLYLYVTMPFLGSPPGSLRPDLEPNRTIFMHADPTLAYTHDEMT